MNIIDHDLIIVILLIIDHDLIIVILLIIDHDIIIFIIIGAQPFLYKAQPGI